MYIEGKIWQKIWKGRGNGLCAESYGFRHGKGRDRCDPGTKRKWQEYSLNILGGLDKATEGNMVVDGTDLEKMSAKELELYRREKLGFVFQSYNLTTILQI